MTSYDEKCFDLARYFYPDMSEDRLNELASLIQVTVEDFEPYVEPNTVVKNGDAAFGPRNGLNCLHPAATLNYSGNGEAHCPLCGVIVQTCC